MTISVTAKTMSNPSFGQGSALGFALSPFPGTGSEGPVQGQTVVATRGKTYAFVTEETNTDYPVYITTSSQGGSEAGEVSNPDVQGNFAVAGEVVFFSPNEKTPNMLYYQSSTGSFMGGQIMVVNPPATSSTTPSPASVVFATGGNPGPQVLKTCVFPFEYNGVTYSQCTCVDLGRPWCALTSSFEPDRYYGYCQGNFPMTNRSFCGSAAASGDAQAPGFAQSTGAQSIGTSSTSPSSSSSSGTIAGIVVGVSVALVALVAAVLVVRRRAATQIRRVDFTPAPSSPARRAFAFVASGAVEETALPRHVSVGSGPLPFRHEEAY